MDVCYNEPSFAHFAVPRYRHDVTIRYKY